MRRSTRLAGLALAGLAAAMVRGSFRRDIDAVQAGVGRNLVRHTGGAPSVEYLEVGKGPPVLVVHGIWGGFDQGIASAGHALDRYHRIFVSRFGYLGSEMPPGATVDMQADSYADLLDGLAIPKVAVIAYSAGSPSAIQFAIRHPDRVKALILVSPAAPGPVDVTLPPRWLAEIAFRSDFLFWLTTRFGFGFLERMMGVPKTLPLRERDRRFVRELGAGILPVSRRYRGALFDTYRSNAAVQEARIEDIEAPVLVVAAKDDPLALFENSRGLARRIRDAELHVVPDGGHLLLGHTRDVDSRIQAFLGEVFGDAESGQEGERKRLPVQTY